MAARELRSKKYARRSQFAEVMHRMKRNRGAMIGLTGVCLFLLMAIFSGVLVDYETQVIATNALERLQGPSSTCVVRMKWGGTFSAVLCTDPATLLLLVLWQSLFLWLWALRWELSQAISVDCWMM